MTSFDIKPGEFYEDAFYHPCICLKCENEHDIIYGVSLIDGSYPRCCSLRFSGIRKLSFEQAIRWRFFGPEEAGDFQAPWLEHFVYDRRSLADIYDVLEKYREAGEQKAGSAE
jgi:hypothetical protein